MTWEQKLYALQALCATTLKMPRPGYWVVSAPDRETMASDGMLFGNHGHGRSPEEAVENDWKLIVKSGATVVIGAMRSDRKEYQWNNFMWKIVGPKQP